MVNYVICFRYGNVNSGVRGFSNRIIFNGGLTSMNDSRISEKNCKKDLIFAKYKKKNAAQPLFSLTKNTVSKILFICLVE